MFENVICRNQQVRLIVDRVLTRKFGPRDGRLAKRLVSEIPVFQERRKSGGCEKIRRDGVENVAL